MAVGGKVRTIVKNFPKLTVHRSAIRGGVLVPIRVNVAIYSAPAAAQGQNNLTVWPAAISMMMERANKNVHQ